MTAGVTTIPAMGQPDQFQANCKECVWGGDVRDTRLQAIRDQVEHNSEAHNAGTNSDSGEALTPPRVEEILEQLEANAPRLAPLYGAHFTACLEQGFTRDEALLLTSDWARLTLWGAQL